IRTREEYDSVHIPGAQFFTQDLLGEIFSQWPKETEIVIYDHLGERSLDAAAYLAGHDYGGARSMRGGIDAYSREADHSIPRYRIELD
ncbi:MAG: rhodanese-like domain-containing protein, partial [Verrucomicrobiales bacterium]